MRRALDDELWIRQTLDAANFGYSEAPAGTREGARWGFALSSHARVLELAQWLGLVLPRTDSA